MILLVKQWELTSTREPVNYSVGLTAKLGTHTLTVDASTK
jgi:hypothetical protein